MSLRNKSSNTRHGVRRWFTRAELEQKWGAQIAEDIIASKLGDPATAKREVRIHTGRPGMGFYNPDMFPNRKP